MLEIFNHNNKPQWIKVYLPVLPSDGGAFNLKAPRHFGELTEEAGSRSYATDSDLFPVVQVEGTREEKSRE